MVRIDKFAVIMSTLGCTSDSTVTFFVEHAFCETGILCNTYFVEHIFVEHVFVEYVFCGICFLWNTFFLWKVKQFLVDELENEAAVKLAEEEEVRQAEEEEASTKLTEEE
jgi:hypothetical protein